MSCCSKIKIGKSSVAACLVKLGEKNLILLKGKRGYVMCGYLNMKAAEKLKDVAVKITGVKSVQDALKTTVHSCTSQARKLGIRKGQPIKEVLKLIA